MALVATIALSSPMALALDDVKFHLTRPDKAFEKAMRQASGLLTGTDQDAQSVHALALAEYGRLVGAAYAAGHYSVQVRVLLDGREAADIPALETPKRIDRIQIIVDPGPVFHLDKARVHPLAPGTKMPGSFQPGKVAGSGVIVQSTQAAIDGWRTTGHAKANVAGEDLVADHAASTLSADVIIDPGPRLRFGNLDFQGHERMRLDRLQAISGFPSGKVYSPKELERVTKRLRRTGVFKSVSLAEADRIRDPDHLDVTASLAENRLRRLTFSAEISTDNGVLSETKWMHRNLWGGAEKLTLSASGAGLGTATPDYMLGVKLERPATITPDTTVSIGIDYGQIREDDFSFRLARMDLLATHTPTDKLTLKAGLGYEFTTMTDPSGSFDYRAVSLPMSGEFDQRDSKTDPTKGYYLKGEVRPFYGFDQSGSGTRLAMDARSYRGFGETQQFVLAGRLQLGAILGADALETPPDYLFMSGGGGTVRGQPYRSLGYEANRGSGGDFTLGGTHFVAASVEARYRLGESLGLVGFVDFGRVDVGGFFTDPNAWHAGAGLGLRYATHIGPLRMDIAGPVGGSTGNGLQLYLGLGQAF
jgi:translocation and assembly module TamA